MILFSGKFKRLSKCFVLALDCLFVFSMNVEVTRWLLKRRVICLMSEYLLRRQMLCGICKCQVLILLNYSSCGLLVVSESQSSFYAQICRSSLMIFSYKLTIFIIITVSSFRCKIGTSELFITFDCKTISFIKDLIN